MFVTSTGGANRHKGFTLIEILTAAVLSTMLLAIFMALTIKFVAVFDRLRSGEARIEDIANRTLDIIEDDLSAAHIDSNFYQYECLSYWDHPSVAEESLGNLLHSGLGSDVPKGLQPDKSGVLLFFSKTLNRSGTQKGDVQAIGYRLAYLDAISPEDDESAFKTFNLYRIVNSPSRTLDMLNPKDLTVDWKGGGQTQNSSNQSHSYRINDLHTRFLVARNIVDFRISFMCSCIIPEDHNEERFFAIPPNDGSDNPITAKLRIGGNLATNETTHYNLPPIIPRDVRIYPSAAEVSITILSDEGLKILWAVRDGNLPSDRIKSLNQLVEEHGKTFTRTVKIQRQI